MFPIDGQTPPASEQTHVVTPKISSNPIDYSKSSQTPITSCFQILDEQDSNTVYSSTFTTIVLPFFCQMVKIFFLYFLRIFFI